MAVGYNPRVITDGLVLALDAGNPKNYNALVSSTNWTDKVGGNNGTLVGGTYHTDGPFVGAGYVEFDGNGGPTSTGSNLEFSSTITLGTGDFTVETWIYNTVASQRMEVWQNTSLIGAFAVSTNFNASDGMNILTRSSPPGSGWSILLRADTELQHNSWNHIAWVRSGGTLTAYLNGVADGNISSSIDSSPLLTIGGWSTGTNYMFGGNLSNLRIIKGTALYTSNFTPPTKPLTAITNTVLLTCQGNSISDASSSGHTITVNGDATANLGFPASAFEFDGVDDYVDCGNNSILDVGNNITVNVWFYVNQTASFETIIAKVVNDYSLGWELDNNSGAFRVTLRPSATQIDLTAGSLSVGNWYMGTMTFDNTTARLYLNGVQTGSTTSGGPVTLNSTQSLTIGRRVQGNYYDGNIAQVSIYNKALTAAEVAQNYNATRGRYGI